MPQRPEFLLLAIPQFCFGYPFVMAWYWMAGGLIFYFIRERSAAAQDEPPPIEHWPPISILVPCYNEGDNAEETLGRRRRRLSRLRDHRHQRRQPRQYRRGAGPARGQNTAPARRPPRQEQGKATALNTGALLARHELLVCIDGDALLDPQALRWIARDFRRAASVLSAGNPRIRNRTSLLGRLQVGEFSSIIGLIRRAQTTYGRMFTVSGVICAFRKRALDDAGWWSPRTITEDIDVTWRVQFAGWRVTYEPNALVWILMPETLRGSVEAAAALGRGRRADDGRLLSAAWSRAASRACCPPI